VANQAGNSSPRSQQPELARPGDSGEEGATSLLLSLVCREVVAKEEEEEEEEEEGKSRSLR
jgi:hypothetical protein